MDPDKDPSIAILEKRMRPGVLSRGGFLGPDESLEAVIDADDRALGQLGLTHQDVADALARILQEALHQRDKLLDSDTEQWRHREVHFRKIDQPRSVLVYAMRWGPAVEVPICNLYQPESVPHVSLESLPPTDVGYLVDSKYQVFFGIWRGFQPCPWDGENHWGYIDFLLLNRATGEYVTGPALIVHLIRQHHFFEGKESPYRTDPTLLVRVLELQRDA